MVISGGCFGDIRGINEGIHVSGIWEIYGVISAICPRPECDITENFNMDEYLNIFISNIFYPQTLNFLILLNLVDLAILVNLVNLVIFFW